MAAVATGLSGNNPSSTNSEYFDSLYQSSPQDQLSSQASFPWSERSPQSLDWGDGSPTTTKKQLEELDDPFSLNVADSQEATIIRNTEQEAVIPLAFMQDMEKSKETRDKKDMRSGTKRKAGCSRGFFCFGGSNDNPDAIRLPVAKRMGLGHPGNSSLDLAPTRPPSPVLSQDT